MGDTVTIRFRGKLERDVSRIDGTTITHNLEAVKVPTLTPAHVTCSDPTTAALLRTHPNVSAVVRSRFTAPAGRWAYVDDPAWTVTPVGRGFLADVVGTFPRA